MLDNSFNVVLDPIKKSKCWLFNKLNSVYPISVIMRIDDLE
jgi:hypothetical protein